MNDALTTTGSRPAMVQDYDDGASQVVDGTSRYATTDAASHHEYDHDHGHGHDGGGYDDYHGLPPEVIPLPPSAPRHVNDMDQLQPPAHRMPMYSEAGTNSQNHAGRPTPAPVSERPPAAPTPPTPPTGRSRASKGKSSPSHRRRKGGDRPEYFGVSSHPKESASIQPANSTPKTKTKTKTQPVSARRSRRPTTGWYEPESPDSLPTLPSSKERHALGAPPPPPSRRNTYPRHIRPPSPHDRPSLPATNALRTSRTIMSRNQVYPSPASHDDSDATSSEESDENPHGLVALPPNPGNVPPPPPPDHDAAEANPHGLIALPPGGGIPPQQHRSHPRPPHPRSNTHYPNHVHHLAMGRRDFDPPMGPEWLAPQSQPAEPHGLVVLNQNGGRDGGAPRHIPPGPGPGPHGLVVLQPGNGEQPDHHGRGWGSQGHGNGHGRDGPARRDTDPLPSFQRLSIDEVSRVGNRRAEDAQLGHHENLPRQGPAGWPVDAGNHNAPAYDGPPMGHGRPQAGGAEGHNGARFNGPAMQPRQMPHDRRPAPGPYPTQTAHGVVRQPSPGHGHMNGVHPDEVEEASSTSGSEYSDEIPRLLPGHPFLRMKGMALETVLKAFKGWQGAQLDPGGYPNGGRRVAFACPFAKKDPLRYRDCFCTDLVEVRDVRRHVIRCHPIPIYCPRCMETFDEEQGRDQHIRHGGCRSRPWASPDGITESQKRELEKRGPTNLSPQGQWFRIVDIVFSGRGPVPDWPYVEADLHQDITMYRDFLAHAGPGILSDILTFRGQATWNLPSEERDLAAFQRIMLEEGIREMVDQWYGRVPGDCHEDESSFDSVNSIDQQRTPSTGSFAISDGQGGRWDNGGFRAAAGEQPPPVQAQRWDADPRIHDDGDWESFPRGGGDYAPDFDAAMGKTVGGGGVGGDGGLMRMYPGRFAQRPTVQRPTVLYG